MSHTVGELSPADDLARIVDREGLARITAERA
jgi:hypothetical protein